MDDQEIIIRELNPLLLQDYLGFFDRDAFQDNPEWASCYCYYHLASHKGKPWEERTGAENRADVSRLIAQGRMQGYLAYRAGRVVAWCHAAPRILLPALQEDKQLDTDDLDHTGAVVCFLVAKPYRRLGLALRLLRAACEGLRKQGMRTVEAYPGKNTLSETKNYPGPLTMYLREDFSVHREFPNFLIVRKTLNPASEPSAD